jgi:hypothetical protein
MNHYALEVMARERLATLRQAAERHSAIRTATRPRRAIRLVVGRAMIRLGTRALGREYEGLATRA